MSDYRTGIKPIERPMKIKESIMKALKAGDKTFSELLRETGASRSALASHLKELYEGGFIAREEKPKDLRLTYYSLTDEGRSELAKGELYSSIMEAPNFQLVKLGSEFEAEIIKMFLPMVNEELMKRIGERISRTGKQLSTEEKMRELMEALENPSIDQELRRSYALYVMLEACEKIKREIEEQRLEREDAERLAKKFSGAFSLGIYSPLPIKEDGKLDNEMCLDAFNLLKKAISKFSWSFNDLERLKSLEKPKIILTVEYNLS